MILRFPGAKTKLLPLLRPYIDRLFEGGDAFHDVFVGSGAVLLDTARRYPMLKLHANDADTGLVAFWRLVASKSVEPLCDRILSTKPTLKLFREVVDSAPTTPHELAFRFYFLNRTSFSGLWRGGPIGGHTQSSRWKVDAEWRAEKSVKDIVEANRLLHGRFEIVCQSGTDYVEGHRNEALFMDPPYFCRGDRLYEQKMTLAEHLRLARLLKGTGNWLLTLDDNPAIRELYAWASVHVIPARYHLDTLRPRRAGAQELIITPSA